MPHVAPIIRTFIADLQALFAKTLRTAQEQGQLRYDGPIEPIAACLDQLLAERDYDHVIYTTPDGVPLGQPLCNRLSLGQNYIILCGHYKGVDERIREKYITLEISIGDYVLSGGELPAMVLLDAVIRQLPGALGHADSAKEDSFADGLLDCPHYTRPESWLGMSVPDVLRGGNHAQVARWRLKQSLARTRARRPELLRERVLSPLEKELLAELDAESGSRDGGVK